jgi:hypothetical protein
MTIVVAVPSANGGRLPRGRARLDLRVLRDEVWQGQIAIRFTGCNRQKPGMHIGNLEYKLAEARASLSKAGHDAPASRFEIKTHSKTRGSGGFPIAGFESIYNHGHVSATEDEVDSGLELS